MSKILLDKVGRGILLSGTGRINLIKSLYRDLKNVLWYMGREKKRKLISQQENRMGKLLIIESVADSPNIKIV